ncbi:MAG: hypothetical protein NC247_01965 [Ruminococcus flavefaciens]|nr:hypothetical protein [Ruminococcus flavefaciens]
MTLEELIQFIKDLAGILAILGIVIEITPIKINPFSWIGARLNKSINKEITELRRDFEVTKANNMRWEILSFANSCRRGISHSKDEWHHILNIMKEYDEYTKEKDIVNGVIEEDSRYLRELYQERNHKNDFFVGGTEHEHSADN